MRATARSPRDFSFRLRFDYHFPVVPRINSQRIFFKQFVRNFRSTGALAPSSRFLASSLARFVREHRYVAGQKPRRILEVGPGTGSVTRAIIKSLGPNDHLTLVEINRAFVKHLKLRLRVDELFTGVKDRVTVIHGRFEELETDTPFDVIVSGLPLNNFTPKEVQEILGTYRRMLGRDGVLSFFEYIAVRRAKHIFANRAERQRLREVGRIMKETLKPVRIDRDMIVANLPPAWVHHVSWRKEKPTLDS